MDYLSGAIFEAHCKNSIDFRMTSNADAILVDAINRLNIIPEIDQLTDLEDVTNGNLFSLVDFFINRKDRRDGPLKMPESTLAAFRMASRFATAVSHMGYPDQVHYQHLLVPNLSNHGDTRKILSWLFFRQNDSLESALDVIMRRAMQTELKRPFEGNARDEEIIFSHLGLQFERVKYDSTSHSAKDIETKILEFRKRNKKIRLKIAQYDDELDINTKNLQTLTEQITAISHPTDVLSNTIMTLNEESKLIKSQIVEFQTQLTKRCDLEERLMLITVEHENLITKIAALTISIDQNKSILNDSDENMASQVTSRGEHMGRISQVAQSIQRQNDDFNDITIELEDVKTQVNHLGGKLEQKYHSMMKMLTTGFYIKTIFIS